MRTKLLVVGLLLVAGCATGNPPPPTGFLEGETPAAQPPVTATKPQVEFFSPAPSRPKGIVFVIDHSGSMTDTIVYVKHELKRSIRSLRPNQAFWITFFSSGPTFDLSTGKSKMLPATEANKQVAYKFVDSIQAVGQTAPEEAIQKAFDRRPDVIYILTDGEFEPSIADLIEKLNAKKEVTVNTIGFIYQQGEPLLKKIAAANNGTYKFVSEDDMVHQKQ